MQEPNKLQFQLQDIAISLMLNYISSKLIIDFYKLKNNLNYLLKRSNSISESTKKEIQDMLRPK